MNSEEEAYLRFGGSLSFEQELDQVMKEEGGDFDEEEDHLLFGAAAESREGNNEATGCIQEESNIDDETYMLLTFESDMSKLSLAAETSEEKPTVRGGGKRVDETFFIQLSTDNNPMPVQVFEV